MVGELFHFSAFRILTSLLPLVTSLLGLGQDCQDQNQKRKFMVLLLHRIAASLVLPLSPTSRTSCGPGQVGNIRVGRHNMGLAMEALAGQTGGPPGANTQGPRPAPGDLLLEHQAARGLAHHLPRRQSGDGAGARPIRHQVHDARQPAHRADPAAADPPGAGPGREPVPLAHPGGGPRVVGLPRQGRPTPRHRHVWDDGMTREEYAAYRQTPRWRDLVAQLHLWAGGRCQGTRLVRSEVYRDHEQRCAETTRATGASRVLRPSGARGPRRSDHALRALSSRRAPGGRRVRALWRCGDPER